MIAAARLMLVLILLFTPLFLILAGIWTALDAARRGRNWFAWSVAVSVTGVALMVWLVVRRRYEVTGRPRYRGFPLALTAGLLFIVALNVLLTRNVSAFLFKAARVEGRSMSPTVENGDRLIVSMSAYLRSAPQREDVVMLRYPLNPERMFVMRVIGEEGDQVRIVDGRVFVNDILLEDAYVAEDARSHEDYGPQVVHQGYYFVLGDRRNNSSDSRHWGFVPAKYIVGNVVYRWWPLGTAGKVR